MVAIDLSAFMQKVIERAGREPDSIQERIYYWEEGDTRVELIVSDRLADIEVHFHVNRFSSDPAGSSYHHYDLTDRPEWNGKSTDRDSSLWTYDALIETVGCRVAATLNHG